MDSSIFDMRQKKSHLDISTSAWTPGERLHQARITMGLKQTDIARGLGVAQSNLPGWEKGATAIPFPVLLALQGLYGLSAAWVGEGAGPMLLPDLSFSKGSAGSTELNIPKSQDRPSPFAKPSLKLGSANGFACPVVSKTIPWDDQGHLILFPKLSLKWVGLSDLERYIEFCSGGDPSDFIWVPAVGHGMSPLITHGSLVLVNASPRVRKTLDPRGIYLVRRNPKDEEARFKLANLEAKPRQLNCKSLNPAYPALELPLQGVPVERLILGRACVVMGELLRPSDGDW